MINARKVARLLPLLVAALATSCLSGCRDNISDRDIELVPLAQVRSIQSGKDSSAALIDPRSPQEFASGRIPGALNIPLPDVSPDKDSIDPRLAKFKLLVVYGNDPGSAVARAMVKRLLYAGARSAKLYAGGMADWTANGLAIDRDPTVKPATAGNK